MEKGHPKVAEAVTFSPAPQSMTRNAQYKREHGAAVVFVPLAPRRQAVIENHQ